MGWGVGEVDQTRPREGLCRMGELNGSSPGLSPGQPIREKEVLLDVIDQGAPHFLHHLEDSLKVVELQGSQGSKDWSEDAHPINCLLNTIPHLSIYSGNRC